MNQQHDFKSWLAEEVVPKVIAIEEAKSRIPNTCPWPLDTILQLGVQPFHYWAQSQTSPTTGTVHPSQLPSSTGPSSSLSTLINKHPQLVLHTGPPGTTLLVPKQRLDPELWEEVHRIAKDAGYAYIAYNKDTGQSGHWKKVTA